MTNKQQRLIVVSRIVTGNSVGVNQKAPETTQKS